MALYQFASTVQILVRHHAHLLAAMLTSLHVGQKHQQEHHFARLMDPQ
jgi:hypothetical protein